MKKFYEKYLHKPCLSLVTSITLILISVYFLDHIIVIEVIFIIKIYISYIVINFIAFKLQLKNNLLISSNKQLK